MSIVVTGASGRLGRLTVEALLRRGVPASDIVATGRDVAGVKDLAAGRPIAYTDLPADKLTEALTGAGLPADLAHVLADADPA
ncbi:hypothetical protein ACWED2_11815 [Amycolatopsis sp. NPDC005003]